MPSVTGIGIAGYIERRTTSGAAALIAAPTSDITVGSWTSSLGGALYAALDETIPDDTDYIYSPDNPTTEECEVKFGSLIDPGGSLGHFVRYRLDAIGESVTFRITLMCGAVQIGQWFETVYPGDLETTYVHQLTVSEADAITDYGDLRLRFLASP